MNISNSARDVPHPLMSWCPSDPVKNDNVAKLMLFYIMQELNHTSVVNLNHPVIH